MDEDHTLKFEVNNDQLDQYEMIMPSLGNFQCVIQIIYSPKMSILQVNKEVQLHLVF